MNVIVIDDDIDDDIDDGTIISHHPMPSLMLIGAMKCGTTSINRIVKQISNVKSPEEETHYFDECSLGKYRNLYYSYNQSLYQFWNISNCSDEGFKQLLLHQTKCNSTTIKQYFIFEKTPHNILWPHIPQIIIDKFVKYGTKILILLRDPTKRLFSGLWHRLKKPRTLIFNERKSVDLIIQYVCIWTSWVLLSNDSYCNNDSYLKYQYISIKMKEFNNKLNELSEISQISQVYSDLFYWILNKGPNKVDDTQWIRGCYAVQIAMWLYRMNNLNLGLKHSIKIIQFEQLFNSHFSFKTIILYLKCYIYSSDIIDNKYNEWMINCIKNNSHSNQNNYIIQHLSSRTETNVKLPDILYQMIDKSYILSVKWLKGLMTNYPNLILHDKWDWSLWRE